ncbi:MAG TPA: sigma-70 family RNA polymerase sigma factor [Candidatus Eisenbergiella merdipullorum]|uniref:Sigma-70 family RNA polymerase sigma factor n=1 Tax=Candidatus Eisenbergiella merdipullorum TaxID=2838553 RepID=A0A9D2L0X9_9FIRM|nr:sigma-70 family RNA polymerase sigma factor [Candidatus Eisenbergiella merdipullorum]
MTEEKERLVLDNLRLAGYMAQKYKSTGIDFDELISISYMGLVKAANSYQPERGKFSSLACQTIYRDIMYCIRKRKHSIHCISLDSERCNRDGDSYPLQEILGTEDPDIRRLDNTGLYEEMISCLNRKERLAVELVVVRGEKQRTAAEQMGISQSYVSGLCKTGLEKMRRIYFA